MDGVISDTVQRLPGAGAQREQGGCRVKMRHRFGPKDPPPHTVPLQQWGRQGAAPSASLSHLDSIHRSPVWTPSVTKTNQGNAEQTGSAAK